MSGLVTSSALVNNGYGIS